MKKILLMSFCVLTTAAVAQDLFPELAGLGKQTQTEKTEIENVEPVAQEQEPTLATEKEISVDLIKGDSDVTAAAITEVEIATETPALASDSDVNAASDAVAPMAEDSDTEEENDNPDEKIQIYITDVEATIVPNNNFSYCFAKLKFSTTTKQPVQQLDVDVTYGPYSDTYNIQNLTKDAEQSQDFALMGQACEHILDMPEMSIKKCVIEGMNENQCMKKVEFIPLRGGA